MKVEVQPGLDTGRCDGAETVFDVLVGGKVRGWEGCVLQRWIKNVLYK